VARICSRHGPRRVSSKAFDSPGHALCLDNISDGEPVEPDFECNSWSSHRSCDLSSKLRSLLVVLRLVRRLELTDKP
jgi:hypothetical protein